MSSSVMRAHGAETSGAVRVLRHPHTPDLRHAMGWPRGSVAPVPDRGSRQPVRRQRMRVQAGLLAADVAAVGLALALQPAPGAESYAYGTGVVLLLMLTGAYRVRISLRTLDEIGRIARAALVPFLPFLGLGTLAAANGLLLQLVATGLALVAARAVAYSVLRGRRRRGHSSEATLIVGAGRVGEELAAVLRAHPEYGLRPVGFVDSITPNGSRGPSLPLLGSIHDLEDILSRLELHRIMVAFGPVREANWVSVLRTAITNDVEVHIVPRFFDIGLSRRTAGDDDIWGIPLYRVRRTALRTATWRLKRTIDVVVSLVALLLAGPLMALLAVAVRISSPGPLIFRQPRLGQHGREFEMLKFRTVRQELASHTSNSLAGVTPVGRWLRRLSLDELPQLWNVLRGDMSLIGPRPERPYFVQRYSVEVPGYEDRHRLPAGLTGWAQVHGLRGETSIHQRARFDNAYIESWSLWLDITILLRTLGAVLRDSLLRTRVPPTRGGETS